MMRAGMSCVNLLMLALFAMAQPVAFAADYVWRNVKVGGGGFAPAIVFSRAERGLAYLRTDMGGAYRWDSAARRWQPLEDSIAESSYFGIESIAADPVDANVVYLAAGMYRRDGAAILRSHDRGASWEVLPTTFRMGGNEDGRGLGERLAIDPNRTSVLYFGSRHDGLQRSRDNGRTWSHVDSFPVPGLGLPEAGRRTNAGLSFVVFDPRSGHRGVGSRTLFVGVADPGPQHLFVTHDGGRTWSAVAGQPRADLLPVQAALDSRGVLYITYCNSVGPSGATDGAVFKYDTRSGKWTDITPELPSDPLPNTDAGRSPALARQARPAGGYMGLSLDRQKPNTLVVATLNRWTPGDTVWKSTDGGSTWKSLRETSIRDVSATPFLRWGRPEAPFGWWIAGVAIDPFDSNFVAYTTGATVYATRDVSATQKVEWSPWVEGVEQTAVITLTSLPEGPTLLSGFGDLSGFAHESLSKSPEAMFANPVFANTNTIDYAGLVPRIVVRSGTPEHRTTGTEPTLAFSTDSGRSWSELRVSGNELRVSASELPVSGSGQRNSGRELPGPSPQAGRPVVAVARPVGEVARPVGPAVVTAADGSAFIVMTPVPSITRDHGKTWTPVQGLPSGAHVVADRVDPHRFYSLDFEQAALFTSVDGGSTFTAAGSSADQGTRSVATLPSGLPADLQGDRPGSSEQPWPLSTAPGRAGDLWFASRSGLFHSVDGGRSFGIVPSDVHVDVLTFGKPPPGRDYPALFAIGDRGDLRGIWRSDDVGVTWVRVNDPAHEYGRRFRCIAGDPRVFGRVYVGTDGRGIVYGEPSAADKPLNAVDK